MRLIQKALTFDDVLLVPAFSNVLPRDTSLKTQLTRNTFLNMPLVSAAMRHRSPKPALRYRHGPDGRRRHHPQEPHGGRAGA